MSTKKFCVYLTSLKGAQGQCIKDDFAIMIFPQSHNAIVLFIKSGIPFFNHHFKGRSYFARIEGM